MKKKRSGHWRNLTTKGRCQAHGQKNPCTQCKKDTIKREQYMARERSVLNEQLFARQRDI